jgi:hypothetical protein
MTINEGDSNASTIGKAQNPTGKQKNESGNYQRQESSTLTQLCFEFLPEGAPIVTNRLPIDDSNARQALALMVLERCDHTRSVGSPISKSMRNQHIKELISGHPLSPQQFAHSINSLRNLIVLDNERGNQHLPEATAARSQGSRPENYVCATTGAEPELALYKKFLGAGVYNRPFSVAENFGVNLGWPELSDLRAEAIQRLKQDDIITLLPFVAEKRTAHRNVHYALETANSDSVIAVSAVRDAESESNVQQALLGTKSRLVRQPEILSCFDWNKIRFACGITGAADAIIPPTGGKGLTMFAGLAWAELERSLRHRTVVVSDTDFIRPWEYDSIAHLAIPLLIDDGFTPRLIKTAKTGAGRNNEAWTREANAMAHDIHQPEITRGMALLCGQLIWPLSGNLAMRGEDFYQIPFATGPGIETQILAYYAGRQLQRGELEVAQVCNYNAVVEDGESRAVRESAMIGRCQLWLRAVLEQCGKIDKPLHEWEIVDIKNFNTIHGGKNVWGAYQSDFHGPQTASKITLDFMLPSIEQCNQLGAIDWKKMKSLQ